MPGIFSQPPPIRLHNVPCSIFGVASTLNQNVNFVCGIPFSPHSSATVSKASPGTTYSSSSTLYCPPTKATTLVSPAYHPRHHIHGMSCAVLTTHIPVIMGNRKSMKIHNSSTDNTITAILTARRTFYQVPCKVL